MSGSNAGTTPRAIEVARAICVMFADDDMYTIAIACAIVLANSASLYAVDSADTPKHRATIAHEAVNEWRDFVQACVSRNLDDPQFIAAVAMRKPAQGGVQ